MSSFIIHEKITTTEAKAKAVRSQVEKLVTKAKTKGATARYLVQSFLTPAAVNKLIQDVALRFQTRSGGYTRLLRIGPRFYDNAPMVVMEWTESGSAEQHQNLELEKEVPAQTTKEEKKERSVRRKKTVIKPQGKIATAKRKKNE